MLTAGLLNEGEKGEIIKIIFEKDKSLRIENMGIRVGKTIEVLSNKGSAPILIKVDEARIAISRGMAMKIMVRKENQ